MAATISFTYMCPRCNEGVISIENSTECPGCGLFLGSKDVPAYEYPYTLSEQHYKYKDNKLLQDRIRAMPAKKATSILLDAFHIMENISDKNSPFEDIRLMLDIAIRSGKIAKAYSRYIEADGKHAYDEQNTTITTGDYHEPSTGPGEIAPEGEREVHQAPEQPTE